ncbi:hypothetical protein V2J09_024147 [Rumex salicifolius]
MWGHTFFNFFDPSFFPQRKPGLLFLFSLSPLPNSPKLITLDRQISYCLLRFNLFFLRTTATIEEQMITKAVKDECPWENLPKRLQSVLSSREEWHRRIIDHCMKKRLLWSKCFARKVVKEGEYYEEMMRYLRRNLALFPYHLAEYVCRVMRVSPFRYYCDMLFEVMRNEQPYDSIPNFSAADALRITGIGRNEFIDIMNKCRSKKIMWKINKSIAKELLPTQPVDFPIEPWWAVCLKLSEEEMTMIDKVCKEEANSYILFDPEIIKGLYQRGLIYFDVPVYPDDRIKGSSLMKILLRSKGDSISLSSSSYCYFFIFGNVLFSCIICRVVFYLILLCPLLRLLYAMFVVASENATVAELATTLQADLSPLQAAASFACRLGWAEKFIDPASVLHDSSAHGTLLSDEEDGSQTSVGSANLSNDGNSVQEFSFKDSNHARVAFIVDANITSYLMMGSVSPGLKSHAVTLYEAGKLGHASIADLCKDLSTLEGARFEGELQEFANHASSLRCVLLCLLSGGASVKAEEDITSNIMGMTTEVDKAVPLGSDESDPSGDNAGAITDSLESDDLTSSGLNEDCAIDAKPYTGDVDSELASDTQDSESKVKPKNDGEITNSIQSDAEKKDARRKRIYRVDILRCESLATLAPATLERLLNRDYHIVLSMIPLPSSSILPGATGPVHLGPPTHSSMTPWMKLVLYTATRNGPLSVVLMKGQCLRLLPAPLAGCEKALIWSWDGASIGGLGGKFEGNLVSGSILLHCLNSLLRHSAVLVQPLSKDDLDKSGKAITIDIPLPLRNSDGSIVNVGEELGLGLVEGRKLNFLLSDLANMIDLWTIGYIRLIKLCTERNSSHLSHDEDRYEWFPLSVEFGIPLFSPKLCKSICNRIISSQLLQTDSFHQHHEAMQGLRKKLRDMCAEYHATGPCAKLIYQKERSKESFKHQMTYASGRWNPLVDPSSPVSVAPGDYQRRKHAMRQRSCREILSFDGSILRSYALSPIYEAELRPIDESIAVTTPKPESEDADSKEVVLPGVNLLYDGSELHPFDICACLQARQTVSLVAEASAASEAFTIK